MKTDKETRDDTEHAQSNARGWLGTIREHIAALRLADDTDVMPDEARRMIEESPLSVLTRKGWRTPGSEPEADVEFEILLTTGGPALRLRGELSEHGEPTDVRMDYQDWGTPWTEYRLTTAEQDDVLAWASVFYFGEGGVA